MSKNRVRPTKKQLAALEIKKANPDMPMGEVMIKAEYKPKTARHPKQNLIATPGFRVAVEEYKETLAGLGLTQQKVAEKVKQFIDAKKPFSSHTEPDRMVDDWQTQIKGVEMLRQDLGITNKQEELTNLTQINVDKGNQITFVNFKNEPTSE